MRHPKRWSRARSCWMGWAACALAVSYSGCAGSLSRSRLLVAATEDRLPGGAEGAVESIAGVRVEALANSWHDRTGPPIDRLVPILVRLENGSPMPLQVALRRFSLVTAAGHESSAISPDTVAGALEKSTSASLAMRLNALREQRLPAGDRTKGFVYFERVEPEEGGVTLRAELVAAGTGQSFGVAEIAFVVSR